MKSKWSQYARNWSDNNPGKFITKNNFNTIYIPFLLNHFKHAKAHIQAGFFITELITFKFENADLSKILVKKRKSKVNVYEGINIDGKTENYPSRK